MLQNILLVGIGSMLGGISRYLISDWLKHLFPMSFPLGTFTVNIIGCFLIGMLSGVFASKGSQVHHLLFAVGFCGSFTTFSTFSLENLQLLSMKAYAIFSLNVGLSVIFGIIIAGLGYMLITK
ncbi:MAG: fluoride efflux transporter CrcB [Odoribacter sp.]